MFERARRRLTIVYVVMIAAILGIFTTAFLLLLTIVLQPNFDVAPDASTDAVAQLAYATAVARAGLALVAANLIAIVSVAVGAWLLAARTLRPIYEAHERQRRFVADASHEMRTPLTVIRATTDNAERSAPDDESRVALQAIGKAAAELATLTADLLTLAQVDADPMRPTFDQIDLSVLVAERLAQQSTVPGRSGIKISLRPDLLVRANPDDVARICDNLVDNAFRYGGPTVSVSVQTFATDHQAALEVSDDGPGIAAADQARMFEPFFRVHADASAPEGTGLGLAIAQTLTRRNRGRLTVQSAPGHGATFRLELPIAR